MHRNRRMTTGEMLKLQGISPGDVTVVVPGTEMGKQIGNAMSLDVVERVMRNALIAAGLINGEDFPDRWRSGMALRELTGKEPVARNALSTTGGRPLILDSGASYHLIDASSLTEKEESNKWKLEEPIGLNSANGVIWAEWCTMLFVPQLGIRVKALILSFRPLPQQIL